MAIGRVMTVELYKAALLMIGGMGKAAMVGVLALRKKHFREGIKIAI